VVFSMTVVSVLPVLVVKVFPVPMLRHSGPGGWKSNCMGNVTVAFPRRTEAVLLAVVKMSRTPMPGTLSNRRAAPHWPRESVNAIPRYAASIPPPTLFATAEQVEGLMCVEETEPPRDTNTSISTVPVSQTSSVTLWA
jgi:hypothetical protein